MNLASLRRYVPVPGSLGARTIRASGWSLAQVFGLHSLRLVSNLIMTRLLLPEAFGLMAMVSTVLIAFALFSDIGIHRSIVREADGADAHFLQVAWVVKIMRGAAIAGCTLATALLLGVLGPMLSAPGTIYADPRLPWLIALSALAPLLQGADSTLKDLASRRLQMGRITLLDVGGQVVTILAMVGFAQISPTVWALMAGMLVGPLVKCIGTHLLFPGPRMRVVWDPEVVDRLWQYGKWLMGSSVFTFLAMNADRMILGALLSASAFGIYVIARIWVDAGRQLVSTVSGQVGFASIGEIVRERPADAPRVFRKLQTVVDAFCLSAFAAMFAFGQELIDLLYTDTYRAAGDHLAILSIGLLVMRFDPFSFLLMNIGNSFAMMVVSALRAMALWASLPLAFQLYGLNGALFAVVLSPMISVPYTLWLLRPILGRQVAIDAVWSVAILGLALAIGFFAI